MGVTRSSLKSGPGVGLFNGATIFPQGDIEQSLEITTVRPPSAVHGLLDERVMDRIGEVRLTPVGEWESFSILWPYRTMQVGASIFGSADVPLVIHSLDGEKHTWKAAAITQMPDISFGAGKSMLGPMQFACVIEDGGDVTDEDSLLAIEDDPFAGAIHTAFDLTKVATETPTISWATGTPTAFKSEEGVNVSFELNYEWRQTDETGRIDARFVSVGVAARFKPMGIDQADIVDLMKLQGAGAYTRGGRMTTGGFNLTISNSVGSIVLNKAAIVRSGAVFGTPLRNGEIAFKALQTFTSGVRDPLWTLA